MMRRFLILIACYTTLSGGLWAGSSHASEAKPKSRMPASVRPKAKTFANINFNDYMSNNANHPALNSRIKDHQNAFADTSQPATISFNQTGSSVRDLAPAPEPPPPAAAAGTAFNPAPPPVDPGAPPLPNH